MYVNRIVLQAYVPIATTVFLLVNQRSILTMHAIYRLKRGEGYKNTLTIRLTINGSLKVKRRGERERAN